MSWKCPKSGTENQDPEQGEYLLMRIKTDIGKALCKRFGPDSEFWTNPQFTCEPPPLDEDEGWQIVPNTGAKNETLLNGRAITSPQIVKGGDVLSVGRESKGVIKLPLLVNPAIEGTECVGCGFNPFLVLKPISMEEAQEKLTGEEIDTSPTEETPAEYTPTEEASAEEAPTEETPAEEVLTVEPSAEGFVTEKIPVEEEPAEVVAPKPMVAESGTMDVVITGCGMSTSDANKVIKELKPGVSSFDIYNLLKDFPQVAFENLSPEEAEAIKARLEAANCTVELPPHSL